MIYLDNASTTMVDPSLKDTIDKYLYDAYGNAGSVHGFGIESAKAIQAARQRIATSLGTAAENIIFTSGGSESNTIAIIGMADYLKKQKLNHIITTKYEHHSVINAMKEMERRGFEVTYLDVPNGVVQYEDFAKAIRSNTGLASIMCVNNELGTKNNLKPIYELCKNKGITMHSDCVQAIGATNIEFDEIADIISISGHKIHSPKGIGCLCARNREHLSNIIYGGQQEFGLRPGTENVPYIVALASSIENAVNNIESIKRTIDTVSFVFGGHLLKMCRKHNIEMCCNAPNHNNVSKIHSIRFDGVDAETLAVMLGDAGVCVSPGAACSSHSSEPSHVLKAIGLTDKQARSTLRISFSEYNTTSQAIEAAIIIAGCVRTLKDCLSGGEQ